jgi:hypothetical protein
VALVSFSWFGLMFEGQGVGLGRLTACELVQWLVFGMFGLPAVAVKALSCLPCARCCACHMLLCLRLRLLIELVVGSCQSPVQHSLTFTHSIH